MPSIYRKVTMTEVRAVLRLRGEGLPKKRIAAQLGLDPKTVVSSPRPRPPAVTPRRSQIEKTYGFASAWSRVSKLPGAAGAIGPRLWPLVHASSPSYVAE